MSTVVDKPRDCEITARYFVVFYSTKSMFCSYSPFLNIFQNYTIIVNEITYSDSPVAQIIRPTICSDQQYK